MARVRHRWAAADPLAPALLDARDDLLAERAELPIQPGEHVFVQARGPFGSYRRTVVADGDGWLETTDYDLGIPWWSWLLHWPVRLGVHQGPPRTKSPWWAPPDHLDQRAAHVLGLLAAACLSVGYLNTLFTQTVAFATDEFGASSEAQGIAGTVVRVGIVIAIGLLFLADRVGRRRILLVAAFVAPVLCALGAVAPSFALLTLTQALGRPIAIALGLLVGIVVVEEMPRNSRAYAVSLLALATGLGAGGAVIALPLADLGVQGWRLIYAASLLFLVIVVSLRRHLPESRRFEVPHEAAPPIPRRRFVLIAATGLLINLLVAPASFFQNRYLKDVRGYSATLIALFTLATNTPGGIGVMAGGRLADTHGRRIVGALATLGGTIGTVVAFYVMGVPLWLANAAGAVVGGAAVPALGVYTVELFPTGRRGLANGLIAALSLVGSSIGLLVAGNLIDQGISYGNVMALLAIGPLAVTVLVAVWYPETAHLELEQINPIDQLAVDAAGTPAPASADGAQEPGDR